MRILVADQNTVLLAAITATFGPHCDLVTASGRDVCRAQLEQQKFDVVIAADRLADYTGLELLSEVPVISPDTLLIFAADPKRLQQLGKRLAVFGLFAVIGYPLTPQKLVDVLRRAREKLQASRPAKVRHVVLESQWDTGERLGLIDQELQDGDRVDDFVFSGPPPAIPGVDAPAELLTGRTFEGTPVSSTSETVVVEYEVRPSLPALTHTSEPEADFPCSNDSLFDVPEPPQWAKDGAANDTAFEPKPGGGSAQPSTAGLPAPPATARSASGQAAAAPAPSPKGPPQPRVRTQTVPTEAQRAAFERALARRNTGQGSGADRHQGGRARPTIQLGSTVGVFSGASLAGKPSKSLADLAKMATSKRPLPDPKGGQGGKVVPNRAVFAVGSGLAAVLILGVLSFEVLRHSGEAGHHMPHAQTQSAQVFSSSPTLMANSDEAPAQLVPPEPQEQPPQADTPPDQPQAQTFDPDSAPPDPPPPPILEHPGPMEPPSMDHTDPPWAAPEGEESPNP